MLCMWAASQTIGQMVTAILTDALNGYSALCWDSTIQDVLSLTMQTALVCRFGDFKESTSYDEAFLKWDDLEIVALGSNVQ